MKVSTLVACLLVLGETGAMAQERPDPARFSADIEAFEAADRQAAPPVGEILFVGSSSIRMWDSLHNDFPDFEIIQRGFGGSHFSDLLHFADRIVFPYEPRLIVVYEGDNDIESGTSPTEVYGDYREFVGRVRERLPDMRIAFIAIKPSIARWSKIDLIREANALIEAHAKTDPLLSYIDIATPMLGSDGQPRPELFIDDGLHLSAEGYALWTEVVKPFLE